jgi:predicted nucleic acid-binding protein
VSGFLLDTNVVSELRKPDPNRNVVRWVSETDESLLYLSVLTLGEVRHGTTRLASGRRRARLEAWLQNDLRLRFRGRILIIDEAVVDRWGSISAAAAASGRPTPVVAALLAATAMQHDLTLVTRNESDITGTGVRVFNPWRD